VRTTFVEYRERAAECLRLSRRTDNPAIKAVYVTLAQGWATLAEQVEPRALDAPGAPLTGNAAAGETARTSARPG